MAFILSTDGKKVAYVEGDNQIGINGTNEINNTSIKIVDTKTGNIKKVVKTSSLKNKNDISLKRRSFLIYRE